MGLTLHHKVGPFCVFLNQHMGERILFMVEEWDMPIEDVERNLRENHLDVEEFWKARESLYE